MMLELLIDELEPSQLIVSTYGIREGMLYSKLKAKVRRIDPLLEEARDAGGGEHRFGQHGDLLDQWIDPLFDDPPDMRRLRRASCLLADVAWQANPGFRADRGIEMALHGNWVAVNPAGRVIMAQALSSNFGRDRLPDRDSPGWCKNGLLERAHSWGLAMRLGQRLSGGVASVLEKTSLETGDGTLRLNVARGEEALIGDAVERRLARLADAVGRLPEIAAPCPSGRGGIPAAASLGAAAWGNCRLSNETRSSASTARPCWSRCCTGRRSTAARAILPASGRSAGLLADAFAALPGEVRFEEPAPVEAVDAAGRTSAIEHGRHLHLTVRPDAPVQLLLTGHMDTVFGVDHEFQQTRWLEDGVLNGPGVADMKGGLAVMLAALKAVEQSPVAGRLGYEVVINSDEEVGSLASAALLARAAQGKRAALTYEPAALPDGTLAGARPGSGNFAIVVHGRSAHAGRNPEDGRNALLAAADLALRLAAVQEPGLSVNPSRIDGGSPSNVVPDLAILRVNLRPRTPEDEARAQDLIDTAVAAIAAERDVGSRCTAGLAERRSR